MEEVHCEGCDGHWHSPVAIDMSVSRKVATLVRSGDTIAAIRYLREATGLSLRDAKGVYLHLTRQPGKCQRCGASLVGSGTVACNQCRSLNYDW